MNLWPERCRSLLFCGLFVISMARSEAAYARCHFVGLTDFSDFSSQPGGNADQVVLVSPPISSKVQWNEAIVSWNAELEGAAALQIQARAIFPDHTTKYYHLGHWSLRPAEHPRESVANQADADGDVETDTLVLKRRGAKLQLRITLNAGNRGALPKLKLIGISFLDSEAPKPTEPPNLSFRSALLDVPERSQMEFEEGGGWCSPTSTSMVLGYWARTLARPEVDYSVPAIAAAVYDRTWRGTGNWTFNTGFAGSISGLRAFATRLEDVAEINKWISAGVPVIASVSYGTLKGTRPGASGHLVVCVGFTDNGDIIVNDPGTRLNVRKVFPRERFAAAWEHSKNTVYLIYPEAHAVPSGDGFELPRVEQAATGK